MNGVTIQNIRYANNTMLLADTDDGLQNVIEKLQRACSNYGMKINIRKTKATVNSEN